MKYYIIAGEASGDLHGSNLIKEIKQLDSSAEFRCWGGDLMEEQGATIVKHYRELAFMGFVAVIANLRTILRNMKMCKKDLAEWAPDVLILIDYPGFNLAIAKYAKSIKLPVHYYISPKIWAWKQGRVKQVKAYVDKMYTIFSFETAFYEKHGYQVDFVGNPLLDSIAQRSCREETRDEFITKNQLENKPIIAFLAGSRSGEIKHVLPKMISVCKHYPQYQFVVAGAPSQPKEVYEQYLKGTGVHLVESQTYALLQHADAALVTSGTATLETALMNIPQVVCFAMTMGKVGYYFLKNLINIRFISLVNILAKKEVVKELVQHFLNEESLKKELDQILFDKYYRQNMLDEYHHIQELLGGEGASGRAASLIVSSLKK